MFHFFKLFRRIIWTLCQQRRPQSTKNKKKLNAQIKERNKKNSSDEIYRVYNSRMSHGKRTKRFLLKSYVSISVKSTSMRNNYARKPMNAIVRRYSLSYLYTHAAQPLIVNIISN